MRLPNIPSGKLPQLWKIAVFNGKTENSLFRLGYVQELFVCLPEGIQYIGDDHHQVWEILLASFWRAEKLRVAGTLLRCNPILFLYNIKPGWWFQPLWKIWFRQLGSLFLIYGKIKVMFQTTNQVICPLYSHYYIWLRNLRPLRNDSPNPSSVIMVTSYVIWWRHSSTRIIFPKHSPSSGSSRNICQIISKSHDISMNIWWNDNSNP